MSFCTASQKALQNIFFQSSTGSLATLQAAHTLPNSVGKHIPLFHSVVGYTGLYIPLQYPIYTTWDQNVYFFDVNILSAP